MSYGGAAEGPFYLNSWPAGRAVGRVGIDLIGGRFRGLAQP